MSASTYLRNALIRITGYWIYKHRDLPVGIDLISDLKHKVGLPMHVVFDVGANIGQTALFFNRHFPDATITSFEPVSGAYNKLAANVKHIGRIRCHQFALGEKKEFLEIRLFPDSQSTHNTIVESIMSRYGNQVEKIEVTTGDTFCREHDIQEIDLLKIDTEGYEMKVLKGFSEMLKKSKIKAIYCEAGFNPDNKRNTFFNDLLLFAHENGFRFFGLYELVNINIKTGYHYANILFVHNDVINKMKP